MMAHHDHALSPVGKAVLVMLLTASAQQSVFGQTPAPLAIDRLSTRLIANGNHPPPAAIWVTDPSLRLEQQSTKRRLLTRLTPYMADSKAQSTYDFVQGLAVTGRLLPAPADTAVLLATPSIDFALTPNSVLTALPKAAFTTVLKPDGRTCQIRMESSLAVEALLQRCAVSADADMAWLIQADGTVSTVLTGSWNQYANALVAPGAWVWLPPASLQQDKSLMADLAHFLATQPLPPPSEEDPGSRPSTSPNHAEVSLPTLGWKPQYTGNDWGETGLLQTPSARVGSMGDIRMTASQVYPYTRMNVFMQPTGWMEFGFRYTDIATALYGATIAGDQTYKDKSLDFKAVLSEERARWPQLALGMRDIGGTGLFSSEYLVASKRYGSIDWNLGLGWGNMGTRAAFANPLGGLFPSLKTRKEEATGQGGTISAASMFAGDAALFGGIQWTSPNQKSVIKVELDSNSYAQEPFGQDFGASSPVNIGWTYRWSPVVDLNLAFERGNRLAFSFTFSGNLRNTNTPKTLDPPPVPSQQYANARTTPVTPWSDFALKPSTSPLAPTEPLAKRLETQIQSQTGWSLLALHTEAGAWHIRLETDDAIYAQERLDRLFAVLATELPTEGNVIHVQLTNFGLPLRTVLFDRTEWLAKTIYPDIPALQLSPTEWARPVAIQTAEMPSDPSTKPIHNRLETGWGPTFSHILGGPNGFLMYHAGVRAYAQYRFDESSWVFAESNLRLLDNYDNFVYNAPSNLPRVRTDQRRYVTSSRATVPVAQLTKTFALGNGHYASAYGGLLESMYAGFGAEWLWRPWEQNLAVGIDINQVQQRSFEQDLGLRDYRTSTGHATLYWNTGFNGVVAKLSAGKYLAGDVGATVDLSRTFSNGTAIGVWATKTNVSAEQFGEGSFDKGIYINIPLDALLPRSTPSMATLVWSPLSRDGGAKLSRRFALFDLTRHADKSAWTFAPTNARTQQDEEAREPKGLIAALFPHRPEHASLGESMRLGSAIATHGVNPENLAWGTGAVLLSMAADQSVANSLGKNSGAITATFNNLPYVLAAGVGTAALGAWGEDARSTAYASLSATTWALGTNLLTKTMLGRSRPDEGNGPWNFKGPNSGSPQSSFASNHVTAAMALATPFAQRYDQPWLYGLVGLTALGRVQSQEHWASDTVAGAILGYAFGTLALQQQDRQGATKFSIAPTGANHIVATYRY